MTARAHRATAHRAAHTSPNKRQIDKRTAERKKARRLNKSDHGKVERQRRADLKKAASKRAAEIEALRIALDMPAPVDVLVTIQAVNAAEAKQRRAEEIKRRTKVNYERRRDARKATTTDTLEAAT